MPYLSLSKDTPIKMAIRAAVGFKPLAYVDYWSESNVLIRTRSAFGRREAASSH